MEEDRVITPGYYWAKANGKEWFNAIIHVYGDSPFCKIEGYDFCKNREVRDIADISEIGPRITEPE